MISEGVLALLIPIAALCIPIVAILTSHQQKMANLFAQQAQGKSQLSSDELNALRREVMELKSLVHQQAIAIDNLARPATTSVSPGFTTMPPAPVAEGASTSIY
jgi:hypothetical protein